MENTTLTLNNGQIFHWNEYGLKTGFPVFYFHGVPSSSLESKLADEVAKRLKIRLIAPDLPGIGDSDFVDNFKLLDWPVMIEQLADYLAIDQFSLLGFSSGGIFALACAFKLPSRVQRVSLVACSAPFETEVMQTHLPEEIKQLYSLPVIDFQIAIDQLEQLSTSAESLIRALLASHSDIDKNVFSDQSVYSSYKANFDYALKNGVSGIASSMRAVILPWGFDLKSIHQDVIIWQGMDDHVIHPAVGQYLAESLPNATLNKIDNAGHFLLMTRWASVLPLTLNL